MADDGAPPRAQETFHQFSRLPIELRLRIWRLASFQSRILTVRSVPRRLIPYGSKNMSHFCSPDPIPSPLHICHESRSEASLAYARAFSAESDASRYIWVNFHTDTIKMNDYAISEVSTQDRAHIRWLVVEAADPSAFRWYHAFQFEVMKDLRDLEILSPQELGLWGTMLASMRETLMEKYGSVQGWECPQIRIIELSTGEQMNYENFGEVFDAARLRWRARSRDRGGG